MSFQDLAKNGGRELSSYQSNATREVEGLVLKLAGNVSQLRKLVDLLGSSRDTVDHRHKIAETNHSIQQLAKAVKDKVTSLHDAAAHPVDAAAAAAAEQQQLRAKRLLQDFAAILQDYKTLQRMAADREAASLPRQPPRRPGKGAGDASLTTPLLDLESGGGAAGAADVESAVRAQAQRQAEVTSLDASVAYHEALIEERDAGIAEIQRQIGEVNEMFQDLAVLISDQGEQLQTVDEAVTNVAARVAEGQRELATAARSSRAARNKCLWVALVAAVIVSVLLILLLT